MGFRICLPFDEGIFLCGSMISRNHVSSHKNQRGVLASFDAGSYDCSTADMVTCDVGTLFFLGIKVATCHDSTWCVCDCSETQFWLVSPHKSGSQKEKNRGIGFVCPAQTIATLPIAAEA